MILIYVYVYIYNYIFTYIYIYISARTFSTMFMGFCVRLFFEWSLSATLVDHSCSFTSKRERERDTNNISHIMS